MSHTPGKPNPDDLAHRAYPRRQRRDSGDVVGIERVAQAEQQPHEEDVSHGRLAGEMAAAPRSTRGRTVAPQPRRTSSSGWAATTSKTD